MYLSKEIREEILKCKPCYFKNNFPKIFSWGELESLINLRPFVNNKRFRVINDQSYSWEFQSWLTDPNTYPPKLLNDLLEKYVCYFSDSSRVNEKVNKICGELEEIFYNSCVDAHIYFTVAKTMEGGFGIHWDYSHNLILQVEGSTRFLLWDVYADEGETERVVDSIDEQPIVDVTMNPGDAVFIPMRAYHNAISQTKRLSISFPICFNLEYPPQDRSWIKLEV